MKPPTLQHGQYLRVYGWPKTLENNRLDDTARLVNRDLDYFIALTRQVAGTEDGVEGVRRQRRPNLIAARWTFR
jgi:hypothetical protein